MDKATSLRGSFSWPANWSFSPWWTAPSASCSCGCSASRSCRTVAT